MARVITIPATKSKYTAEPINAVKKRRVAAYARVSTDHEEQLTSYDAQVDYYTNYINKHDDWEFVSVYADEGITGCNTKKRDGFNTMVNDALSGKIDLIITKSVSRFARNTVDSLSTIRKLKDKKVECYFEKENIWTFDGKGELLLTIMSSLAQEESRSISENVKWGQRKRFADGKVSVPFGRFLGYKRGDDGGLVVDEDEAVVVRKIYSLFLDGLTPHAIAKRLTSENIPTPGGKTIWNPRTVQSILQNEKYKGDALLQKCYIADFLSKKQVVNNGEIPQYYVEDDHEAIISHEVFEMVQQEFERRKKGKGRYSGVDIFASKLRCGECGSYYGSKVWHSNSKYRRVIYQCNKKFENEHKCSTPHFYEEEIKELFIKAVNKLIANKKGIISNLETGRAVIADTSGLEKEKQQAQQSVTELADLLQACIERNARTVQNQDDYNREYNSLSERYNSAKEIYDSLESKISECKVRSETIEHFIKTLKGQQGILTEFDDNLWGGLLDYITVYSKDNVRFTFKDGTEIKA